MKYSDYENTAPYPPRTMRYDSIEYREMRQQYDAEEARLMKKFRSDLEDENGIAHDHPKAQKLWSMAWEYGHASGIHEVANYYEEFADLVH